MIKKANFKQKEFIELIEKKYPLSKAENWDFVGYSLKNKKTYIKKILLTLDVNNFSIELAIKKNVDLIISFHPFLFGNSWKEVYKYDFKKREQVQKLKQNNIAVYSLHTNFEQDVETIRFQLLKKLKIKKNKVIFYKFSFIFRYNNRFISLVNLLKTNLNINQVLTNYQGDYEKKINKIYVAPGAGDIYEFLKINQKEKVDLLITSDIKWNEQQLLNSLNINFLIISHKIEDVFVDILESFIKDELKINIDIEKFTMDDFIKSI